MSVNTWAGCMSVKIRVSSQVTVRRQDPKPKKNMERSQKAIPLYPRNVRRLPGPPIYPFFWGDGKPPWLGGPKAHSPHDMFIHVGFESRHFLFLFRFTWKWDFATPPHRHMHARSKVYVSRLLLRSYDFQWKWWCTMALPSAMVHLLSLTSKYMVRTSPLRRIAEVDTTTMTSLWLRKHGPACV